MVKIQIAKYFSYRYRKNIDRDRDIRETSLKKIARRTTGAKDFYLVQGIDAP